VVLQATQLKTQCIYHLGRLWAIVFLLSLVNKFKVIFQNMFSNIDRVGIFCLLLAILE